MCSDTKKTGIYKVLLQRIHPKLLPKQHSQPASILTQSCTQYCINPVRTSWFKKKSRIGSIVTESCINPARQDEPPIDPARQVDLQDYLNPARQGEQPIDPARQADLQDYLNPARQADLQDYLDPAWQDEPPILIQNNFICKYGGPFTTTNYSQELYTGNKQ